MSGGMVQFKVDESGFTRAIKDFAAVSLVSFEDAFRTQGRLLAAELMKRTPPFSGKTITKMLAARGAQLGFRDAEIEDMTAFAVGKRRVEKDIRKVIYGVKGAAIAGGVAHGPLHGVPLAHKDMYYISGKLAECGSKLRKGFVAPATSTAIVRLDQAGSIRLGALHMANLYLFHRIRRRARIRLAPPPVRPQMQHNGFTPAEAQVWLPAPFP